MLVPGMPFHLIVIFVGKARSQPESKALTGKTSFTKLTLSVNIIKLLSSGALLRQAGDALTHKH